MIIKRSPQEIADIFQCYVVQASKYEGSSFRCSAEKPKLSPDGERWEMKSWIDIPDELIEIPENHIWTQLYEPQPCSGEASVPDNKKASYSKESVIPDNKDHSSEVHIGDRYVLLGEFQPDELMQKVEEHLNNGFKLYGNPFTGPDTSYGYIHYQAMVR